MAAEDLRFRSAANLDFGSSELPSLGLLRLTANSAARVQPERLRSRVHRSPNRGLMFPAPLSVACAGAPAWQIDAVPLSHRDG